ncbi:hypothetical protein DFH11DRAFT_1572877 [Phellopilus nigrolimitatus]|nr:hypothetical protein DFH11DRAFT_1572877 [Phellopilus nigrolimitatus]
MDWQESLLPSTATRLPKSNRRPSSPLVSPPRRRRRFNMSTASQLSSPIPFDIDGIDISIASSSTRSPPWQRASGSGTVSMTSGPGDTNDPLPAPTTLATHTSGPRLLKSHGSRSGSRSSRGSRSSSSTGSRAADSAHSSRQSSQTRYFQTQTRDAESVLAGTEPPSTTNSTDAAVDERDAEEMWDDQEMVLGYPEPEPIVNAQILESNGDEPYMSGIHGLYSGRGEAFARLSNASAPPREVEVEESQRQPPRPTKRQRRAYIQTDTEPGPSRPRTQRNSAEDIEIILLPDEIQAQAQASSSRITTSPASSVSSSPVILVAPAPVRAPLPPLTAPKSEPLASYACPICFSPPTNATLTPCGHICCGECLFTAVRTALERGATMMTREPIVARCPVCRATLKGWDGRGGGVIGLKPRTIISL